MKAPHFNEPESYDEFDPIWYLSDEDFKEIDLQKKDESNEVHKTKLNANPRPFSKL